MYKLHFIYNLQRFQLLTENNEKWKYSRFIYLVYREMLEINTVIYPSDHSSLV